MFGACDVSQFKSRGHAAVLVHPIQPAASLRPMGVIHISRGADILQEGLPMHSNSSGNARARFMVVVLGDIALLEEEQE